MINFIKKLMRLLCRHRWQYFKHEPISMWKGGHWVRVAKGLHDSKQCFRCMKCKNVSVKND